LASRRGTRSQPRKIFTVQASTTANAKAAIVNQRGLHARPCHTLVRCALEFSGQVEISCEGRTANGKSILELMTLSAGKGAVLEFKATSACDRTNRGPQGGAQTCGAIGHVRRTRG
jgi:phosphotransferase system HPr (HPr) family protein